MSISNHFKFIREIELFEDLTDVQVEILCGVFHEKKYGENELLFSENSQRKQLFVLKSGNVELFKTTPFGEEKRLSFFSAGDFLGEASLFEDSPHSTNARTVDQVVLFEALSSDIIALKERDSEITLKIVSRVSKVISRRMSHANYRLVNLAAQYVSGQTRKEHDLLGFRDVPFEFYYGVQTLRARENFNITGVQLNFYPTMIKALAMVKWGAAKANHELGLLNEPITDAITEACMRVYNGRYHKHFVVDMVQGGAGTSTNMNANEVIANIALEILGYKKGEYKYCHPNNHVNLSQSTNDAYPTSAKIALINSTKSLVSVLTSLIEAFKIKAQEFAHIIKMGRTQLQDAVPMTLGQEFKAYATTLTEEIDRLTENANLFSEINMGATAIGTGINSDPEYSQTVLKYLREITGLDLKIASDLVEATSDTGSFVMYSAALKRLAIKLSKISNDLRLLSSGPRAGFNEINLPPMQPGSSIMPGKVNPVIPEVVNQIAFKVIGNDLTVSIAAEAGQLELNVMEPVIVYSLLESIEMLKNGMKVLQYKAIEGITANEEVCRRSVMNSIGLVTALNPHIGYEASSEVAQEAALTGKGVYEIVLAKGLLSQEELDEIMKPENMIQPHRWIK
jgi:aspartate ammonia-lyase